MTYTFKLSRRIARFRASAVAALLVALAACDNGDPLGPATPAGGDPAPQAGSTSFVGGLPFGMFAQPVEEWGSRFNGGYRNIYPQFLLNELAAIKSRGGKVVLMFAGSEQNYKDAAGHFSLSLWKARIDRYKDVNFSSYISDGTIIGHYLIDEPQDTNNWNGTQISQSTLEAMAKYSKTYWPGMATIVRSPPEYLAAYSGTYQYVDAAWAQYVIFRWPDTQTFLSNSIAKAKSKGLALIVGMNVIDGGSSKGTPITASQLKTYGSALMATEYPCAFISWQYRDEYISMSGVRDAMSYLRNIADTKPRKTCFNAAGAPDPEPEPEPPPTEPTPPPTEPTPPPPTTSAKALSFGLYQAPTAEYTTRWTGSFYKADPKGIGSRLSQAASSGMRLVVMLVRPADAKNSDGTFSLTKWKAQVDRYRTLGLDAYVPSGTLFLHNLIEQPTCASCWGGRPISWDTIEEMAKYSKSIWPGLATSARVPPSQLAAASFSWTYLDAGWILYNTRMGDVSTWLAREAKVASQEGLSMVAGLNLLDAAGAGSPSMTASQVKQFGTVLARSSSVCALVGWKYDSGYLSQTGIRTALDSVATVARNRSVASCMVS